MSADRKPYKCARGPRCSNAIPAENIDQCSCQCHGQSQMNQVCDIEGGCGHLHEEQLVGGAILTNAGLCTDCTDRVAEALADLPMSYVELHFLLASGESGITSDVVTGTREKPVPIRLSVEALQASLVHETEMWAEAVAERLGITWSSSTQLARCRRGFVLQRASRLLSNSVDTLLRIPEVEYRHARDCDWIVRDGIDAALELFRIHGLVRFACGKTKLIHRLPAPCPRCERLSLVRKNGSDLVECELCPRKERAWWSIDEYKRLTLVLADSWQDEAPVREHSQLASLAEGTIRGTVHEIHWTELPKVVLPEAVA